MENQLIREQVFDVLFNYVKRADGIYTKSDCATVRDEICLQIDQSQFTADEAEEHINQEVERRIKERITDLDIYDILRRDIELSLHNDYKGVYIDGLERAATAVYSRLVSQKTEGGTK